jgi:SAM-dependent methyltransferase
MTMKANTSRRLRFAFDDVADAYDRGRPDFDDEIVRELTSHAGLHAGDPVLEIGAGTGQLTRGLIRAGLQVEALEPGRRLASRLRSNLGAGALRVLEAPFEEYTATTSFAAVFAANAFHWIDPAVSYRKAHGILRPTGALCTVWNFPVMRDPGLQTKLNDEAFTGDLEQFRRDPHRLDEQVDKLLAEGRAELAATGLFVDPWWHIRTRTLSMDVDRYLLLLASYANGAAVVDQIAARVPPVLDARPVELTDLVGLCVARRSP